MHVVVAWMAAASVVGFALMARDKGQARAGHRRIRERTLLAWAFVGGWPGMALAMVLVRHKTRKGRFLVPFAATAIANPVAVVLLARRFDFL